MISRNTLASLGIEHVCLDVVEHRGRWMYVHAISRRLPWGPITAALSTEVAGQYLGPSSTQRTGRVPTLLSSYSSHGINTMLPPGIRAYVPY